MKIFNTAKIDMLKKALDVYQKQHEAIAKNIANANNPEYDRTKTDFSDFLASRPDGKMRTTSSKHVTGLMEPLNKAKEVEKSAEKSVDISKDMGELAGNQVRYEFAGRALARAYQALNASITGRTN